MKQISMQVILSFPGRYIADPYWPALEELINIQKASGINRSRSEQKREQALTEYLRRQGMTMDDYRTLEQHAHTPWYRNVEGEIIIPSHQMYGSLIAACDTLSASQRPCPPDNLRHLLHVSDFLTGKRQSDGIYKRLVMPKSGSGQPLSNQRSLRANDYIEHFDATGTIAFFSETLHNADELQDFLTFAGMRMGVGACRKMGIGRYLVKSFHGAEVFLPH